MKKMPLEQRGISSSRIALGCMGFGGSWNAADAYTREHVEQAKSAVDAALSIGINFFDHADIYTRGKAELIFGEILKTRPSLRQDIVIQSKCGIQLGDGVLPARYNFSKEHILSSVDGILQRLGTDYIDILLLHRPDPLMEPEEIAEAFAAIKASGKVKHFGVSNMHTGHMKYIKSAIQEDLVVNQLEMSLSRHDFLDQTVLVNQQIGANTNFEQGLMEYLQLENVQIQAWGPLSKGIYTGALPTDASESVKNTAKLVAQYAAEKETTKEAIALGWLMKHPAMIQPVIGSTNPERIIACQDAVKQSVRMSRDEWWTLYATTRGIFPA